MGSTNIGPDLISNHCSPGEPPGPSQQGCIGTCVAHSLAKCVLATGEHRSPSVDFRQDEVIAACVQLGGENAARVGSWPDGPEWNGKSILPKDHGVSADAADGHIGKTFKAAFTIQECKPDDFDDENEHVLVLHTDQCPGINAEQGFHCVYLKFKKGKFWYFLNSHGNQSEGEMKIEIKKKFNRLYKVEVNIQEIKKPSKTSLQGGSACFGTAEILTQKEQLDKMKKVFAREISFDSVEVFANILKLKEVYNEWATNPALGMTKTKELRVDFIIQKWKDHNGHKATPKEMSKKLEENPAFTNIKDEFNREFGL